MNDTFMEKFELFLKKWEERTLPHFKRVLTNLEWNPITYSKGKRYMKVIHDNSIVAFVDISTGDIYKPASWSKPAKHVRGNIYSDQNGMEAIIEGYILSIRYLI